MLTLKSLPSLTVTVLTIVSFKCIKSSEAGIQEYYPGYYEPSYKYTYPYGYKRGPPLDRISMSFIKRANENRDNDIDDFERTGKYMYSMLEDNLGRDKGPRSMNRYSVDIPVWSIVRQRRSAGVTNTEAKFDNTNRERLKELQHPLDADSKENNNKTNIRDVIDNHDNRYIDMVNSGSMKTNVDKSSNRFQREPNMTDILNHDLTNLEKAEINQEDEQIKESTNKRAFDRLSSNFIKRVAFEANKRPFDRINSGFVKKDNNKNNIEFQDEDIDNNYQKRYFDRVGSGFVKKASVDDVDDDELLIKRYFDRLNSGFVKKDDEMPMQDTADDNLKSKNFQTRGFDRVTSGFIKRSSTEKDDNSLDNISSEFKDNDDMGKYKRSFDRLSSGFVKKSNIEEDKRGFDRLSSGFVKRAKGYMHNNSDFTLSNNVPANNEYDVDEEKRGFDRISSAFVKRPFDRLSVGFVKRLNAIYDDLKKEDRAEKRYFDRLDSGFVRRNEVTHENGNNTRFRKKRSYWEDRGGRFDRIGHGLLKRYDEQNNHFYSDALSHLVRNSGSRRLSKIHSTLKQMLNEEDV